MTGSATLFLRGFGRAAARNNGRIAAGCWAASVLCVIIFMGFGAQPHSSILALDVVGLIGVTALCLGLLFVLLNKVGAWWASAVAIVLFALIFSPAFL